MSAKIFCKSVFINCWNLGRELFLIRRWTSSLVIIHFACTLWQVSNLKSGRFARLKCMTFTDLIPQKRIGEMIKQRLDTMLFHYCPGVLVSPVLYPTWSYFSVH
jgi:hypothetical protein